MSAEPAGTPTKNTTLWKIIIPIAIVLILCCLCAVTAGVLYYLGTQGSGPFASLADSPLLTPSVVGEWDLYYDWYCSGDYDGPITAIFLEDGSYQTYEIEGGDRSYGAWTLRTGTLDIYYDGYPNAHYTGILSGSTHIEGTMTTDSDLSGCWYADKR